MRIADRIINVKLTYDDLKKFYPTQVVAQETGTYGCAHLFDRHGTDACADDELKSDMPRFREDLQRLPIDDAIQRELYTPNSQ